MSFGILFLLILGMMPTSAQILPFDSIKNKPSQKITIPKTQLLQNQPAEIKTIKPASTSENDDGVDEDEIVVTEGGVVCLNSACTNSVISPSKNLDLSLPSTIEVVNAALVQTSFQSYSESPLVIAMIKAAREHIRENPSRYIIKRKGMKTRTYCYRAVKDALRESALVPLGFYGSAEARFGVSDLKSVGFKNMLEDPKFKSILENRPKLAPKGAILVYETSPPARASLAGHIEIKTQNSGIDGYISISETTKPTYGYDMPQQRRLIGVMYKN